MKILKKIELEAISFCIKNPPANKLRLLISKSDEDEEQAKIDELDDVLMGIDSFANTLNEGLRIAKSKINAEDLEGLKEDVAETLGLQVKGSEIEEDLFPSVPEIRKGVVIYAKKEEDETIEEEEETEPEFIRKSRDPQRARELMEKGLTESEILTITGSKGVKKSIDSDTEDPEEEEKIDKTEVDYYPSLDDDFGRPGYR